MSRQRAFFSKSHWFWSNARDAWDGAIGKVRNSPCQWHLGYDNCQQRQPFLLRSQEADTSGGLHFPVPVLQQPRLFDL